MIHVSLKRKSNTLQDVSEAKESLVGNRTFSVNLMMKLAESVPILAVFTKDILMELSKPALGSN